MFRRASQQLSYAHSAAPLRAPPLRRYLSLLPANPNRQQAGASSISRTKRLGVVSEPIGGVADFGDRYQGSGTHRLLCGGCGFDVAVGVDPYLYPAMFAGAGCIQCSRCSSFNVLPADL